MITHILLSLPNPKFRREILEYPYDLGGLQLHNLERFSSSHKITLLRRRISTDSGWTTFALAYEIDKCWMFGNDFTETKKKFYNKHILEGCDEFNYRPEKWNKTNNWPWLLKLATMVWSDYKSTNNKRITKKKCLPGFWSIRVIMGNID